MEAQDNKQDMPTPKQRREQAIRMCAPGTSLRMAIDMIIFFIMNIFASSLMFPYSLETSIRVISAASATK